MFSSASTFQRFQSDLKNRGPKVSFCFIIETNAEILGNHEKSFSQYIPEEALSLSYDIKTDL